MLDKLKFMLPNTQKYNNVDGAKNKRMKGTLKSFRSSNENSLDTMNPLKINTKL